MKLAIGLPRPRPVDVVVLGENSMDLVATVGRYPNADSKVELRDLA
jgi:hypothetical protein